MQNIQPFPIEGGILNPSLSKIHYMGNNTFVYSVIQNSPDFCILGRVTLSDMGTLPVNVVSQIQTAVPTAPYGPSTLNNHYIFSLSSTRIGILSKYSSSYGITIYDITPSQFFPVLTIYFGTLSNNFSFQGNVSFISVDQNNFYFAIIKDFTTLDIYKISFSDDSSSISSTLLYSSPITSSEKIDLLSKDNTTHFLITKDSSELVTSIKKIDISSDTITDITIPSPDTSIVIHVKNEILFAFNSSFTTGYLFNGATWETKSLSTIGTKYTTYASMGSDVFALSTKTYPPLIKMMKFKDNTNNMESLFVTKNTTGLTFPSSLANPPYSTIDTVSIDNNNFYIKSISPTSMFYVARGLSSSNIAWNIVIIKP